MDDEQQIWQEKLIPPRKIQVSNLKMQISVSVYLEGVSYCVSFNPGTANFFFCSPNKMLFYLNVGKM